MPAGVPPSSADRCRHVLLARVWTAPCSGGCGAMRQGARSGVGVFRVSPPPYSPLGHAGFGLGSLWNWNDGHARTERTLRPCLAAAAGTAQACRAAWFGACRVVSGAPGVLECDFVRMGFQRTGGGPRDTRSFARLCAAQDLTVPTILPLRLHHAFFIFLWACFWGLPSLAAPVLAPGACRLRPRFFMELERRTCADRKDAAPVLGGRSGHCSGLPCGLVRCLSRRLWSPGSVGM